MADSDTQQQMTATKRDAGLDADSEIQTTNFFEKDVENSLDRAFSIIEVSLKALVLIKNRLDALHVPCLASPVHGDSGEPRKS